MAADFSVPDWLIDRASAPADPPDPAKAEREAARRYGRILSASAAASRALSGLDERFARDTDFADAPLRYREELDAIGREQEESFGGDPVGRALFRRDFGRLAEHAARRFEEAQAQREAAHWARTLEERWDSLAALARGTGGEGRAEILRQAAVEAHRARSFGLVPDAGAAFQGSWRGSGRQPRQTEIHRNAGADRGGRGPRNTAATAMASRRFARRSIASRMNLGRRCAFFPRARTAKVGTVLAVRPTIRKEKMRPL